MLYSFLGGLFITLLVVFAGFVWFRLRSGIQN